MSAPGRIDGLVVLESPERTAMLGLLMRGLLAASVRRPGNTERLKRLSGDVQVRAGEMTATLRFGSGRLTIIEGPTDRPRARVAGGMSALLGLVAGGGLVWPVLSGRIRVGGNLLLLLRMLPLIRSA